MYGSHVSYVWGSHGSFVGGSPLSYRCCVVVFAAEDGVVHRYKGVMSHMNGGVIFHM